MEGGVQEGVVKEQAASLGPALGLSPHHQLTVAGGPEPCKRGEEEELEWPSQPLGPGNHDPARGSPEGQPARGATIQTRGRRTGVAGGEVSGTHASKQARPVAMAATQPGCARQEESWVQQGLLQTKTGSATSRAGDKGPFAPEAVRLLHWALPCKTDPPPSPSLGLLCGAAMFPTCGREGGKRHLPGTPHRCSPARHPKGLNWPPASDSGAGGSWCKPQLPSRLQAKGPPPGT